MSVLHSFEAAKAVRLTVEGTRTTLTCIPLKPLRLYDTRDARPYEACALHSFEAAKAVRRIVFMQASPGFPAFL